MSFDLILHSNLPEAWTNVLAFKANGGEGNKENPGDRNPAVFYNNNWGTLYVQNSVRKQNVQFPVELGKWFSVEIGQNMKEGKVNADD